VKYFLSDEEGSLKFLSLKEGTGKLHCGYAGAGPLGQSALCFL
jgi:hypothetical protein